MVCDVNVSITTNILFRFRGRGQVVKFVPGIKCVTTEVITEVIIELSTEVITEEITEVITERSLR